MLPILGIKKTTRKTPTHQFFSKVRLPLATASVIGYTASQIVSNTRGTMLLIAMLDTTRDMYKAAVKIYHLIHVR